MARRYIKHESTLNVIIREADLDQERAAAVKLAGEVDPHHERTIEVLTKCDSFSKPEGKEEMKRLVSRAKEQQDFASNTSLAVHLTCCDPDRVTEEEYFKGHSFNDYENVGDAADKTTSLECIDFKSEEQKLLVKEMVDFKLSTSNNEAGPGVLSILPTAGGKTTAVRFPVLVALGQS